MYGHFGGQAAFESLRDRFRTQGAAATAPAAERAAPVVLLQPELSLRRRGRAPLGHCRRGGSAGHGTLT